MTSARTGEKYSRLVIGAPQGRSGKTTVALGLAAALAARGLAVQPFKKGPDYIDPSWLSAASGRPCRTLDPFFMPSPAALRAAFARGFSRSRDGHPPLMLQRNDALPPSPGVSQGRESGEQIALVEGNHGLFDDGAASEDAAEGTGSTAELARILDAPVLLVLNVARTGRSAAALVLGCLRFEPDTPIAGVVLNRVAGPRHEDKLRQSIERHCGVPVLGALAAGPALAVPDRHLGLVPVGEEDRNLAAIDACRRAVEQGCSLDAILDVARSALPFEAAPVDFALPSAPAVRIGVFRDRAFSFYYYENLEALVEAGADLVFVDALRDSELPPVDALYIGGGFPEVFVEELSANRGLRTAVRAAAGQGLPIYAECGGLMYLSQAIRWGDRSGGMAGVLPFGIEMTGRPQGHGYVAATVETPNPFFELMAQLRGHEFHNSSLIDITEESPLAYRLSRGRGLGNGRDGIVYRNVLASYIHLHAAGAPRWAEGLVRRAAGRATV